MAEVHGFWSEAIGLGVRALRFSVGEMAGSPWMDAQIADQDIAPAVRRAAFAAIAVDKDIAYSLKMTPVSIARSALMVRRSSALATVELAHYQRLLAVEVLKRVASNPAALLEALAEPYERGSMR